MEDIHVIFADLPGTVKGMVVKTFDESGGDDFYTIVINASLCREVQIATYWHEVKHIRARDFDSDLTADEIEAKRHTV